MMAAAVIIVGVIRTQISLTQQQQDALRRLAAVRRRSQAALLRDALDELLASEPRTVRAARARAATGAFASGRTDTSERHDDELDETFAS